MIFDEDDGQYRTEDWEAIVEAVLFTMGNSVELKQLAVAIGQSEEIANVWSCICRNDMRKKNVACAFWSWKTLTRCAPARIIMRT